MIEIIILSSIGIGATGALVSGLVSWRFRGIQERKFHSNPDRDAPSPGRTITAGVSQPMLEARREDIPKDIRDELDQTPDWWDRKFHAELEAAGAKVVARRFDEDTYKGRTRTIETKALEGCECRVCVSVMMGKVDEALGAITRDSIVSDVKNLLDHKLRLLAIQRKTR